MLHLLKYRLIQTVRNKNILFWSILFPFALSLLYYFSFMNGGVKESTVDPIPVAVSAEKQSASDEPFLSFAKEMDGKMLKVKYISEKKAKEELKTGKIKGIYTLDGEIGLTVSTSGIEEGILETLLNTYNQNKAMVMEIAKTHPEKLEEAVEELGDYQTVTKDTALGGNSLDGDIQYFFALIAMCCLYGCFIGFPAAVELKANLRPLGARRCVTPTRKSRLIFTDMIVALGVHYMVMLVFLLFLRNVLNIGFRGDFGGLALVCLFGSMIGVGMGMMIGSIGRASESTKLGMIVAISMFMCFFSGLMFGQMKYIIEKSAPIFNRINPAAVISDAIYCLVVYNDHSRYVRDLFTLFVMSLICIGISYLAVRRERYESI